MCNEAVNIGVELRKEKIRRGSDRFIRQIDTQNVRNLRSDEEVFRLHLQSWFNKEHSLCEQEFRSYLTDLSRLSSTEETWYEGENTEGRVLEKLKRVDSGNSPEVDGLPFEL